MKTCTKCKQEKPFSEFHKDKKNKDGLRNLCKSCIREYQENYFKKLSERTHIERPKTKICSVCKVEKSSSSEFFKDKTNADGLQPMCKSCNKELTRKYRQKLSARSKIEIPKMKFCNGCNKEKSSSQFNKSKSKKDGLNSRCRACSREVDRNYRKNLSKRPNIEIPKTKICPDCKREKSASKFPKNKRSTDGLHTRCKYCTSEYRKVDRIKKLANKRRRERYQNDVIFKLQAIVRASLRRSISLVKKSSDKDIKKSKKSLEYLGCTVEELKIHLEKQFYPNPETGEEMTWENHAFEGWHVDHIKPLATFDLTKEEEILKANHYTNLQPLWSGENFSKGSNYSHGESV